MEINGSCPRWRSGTSKAALDLTDASRLGQEAEEASCSGSAWTTKTCSPQGLSV
jgi:hypothetical protein